MGRHISDDQRNAITAMCKDGVGSLEISKALSIPHITVKKRYERVSEPQKENTNLKGIKLYCLQELARLLCWPAPKLADCLRSYIPKLNSPKLVLKGSRPNKKPKGVVCNRTIQRYLAKCGIMDNVREVWSSGSISVHAVQISWWEHGFEINKVMRVDKKKSKIVTGNLLLLAERDTTAKKIVSTDLRVKLQLFQGKMIISEQAIRTISAALQKHYKNISKIYLVSDSQGKPTAVDSVEDLRSVLEGIEIVIDKPTAVKGKIEIPVSFPSPRSVENYLAIIMALKSGTPNFRESSWQEIHNKISNDYFLVDKIGNVGPFLNR